MQTILATLSATTLAFAALAPGAPAPAAVPAGPAASAYLCDDAYLGVYVVPSAGGGAEVTRLMDGSPAARAGIQPGDRIVALGGERIPDADALIAEVEDRVAGEEVEVVLFRDDDKRILSLTLGNRAESEAFAELPGIASGFFYEDPGGPGVETRLPLVLTDEDLPFEPQISPRITWVPADESEPSEAHQEALQARVEEMRERMDDRYRQLADRLDEFREARDHGEELRARMDEFRREMDESRREQERRLDELREAVRASLGARPGGLPTGGLRWEGADGQRHEARIPLPVRVGGDFQPRATPPRLPTFRVSPERGVQPASADDVRALHDDVRELREEIRELKELLGGRR